MTVCTIPGCERSAVARRLCLKHYDYRRRTVGLAPLPTAVERFWSQVDKTEGCWLWRGRVNELGYGLVWAGGRDHRAHRFAYNLLVGPIAEGLELDHLCRVPSCVNPAHLEAVTHAENLRRGRTRGGLLWEASSRCKRGHEYNQINTYYTKTGTRDCRVCRRERWRNRADR